MAVIVATPRPFIRALLPSIVTIELSELSKLQLPGELEVGGVSAKVFEANGCSAAVTSANVPKVGGGPCTVTVIDLDVDAKLPKTACVAVIVARPTFRGVNVVPTMEATVGSDEENVHAPNEGEVGGTSVIEETEPKVRSRSRKGPIVGAPPVTVTVVVFEVLAQFQFAACVAVIVAVPKPTTVRIFPWTLATRLLELE